mgnify:CR=1 FL=1
MDKLALAGVVLAIAAIMGGYAIEGGGVSTLFNLSAFLIVFGGSLGAVMIQTPNKDFVYGIKLFPQIWQSPKFNLDEYQLKIFKWTEIARQKGFLALEPHMASEEDEFVRKSLMMLIDGADNEVLKDALVLEIELDSEKKLRAANVYESLGGYSPTIGILGAVLGLIQAMTNISDAAMLGQGIATAFVATIYGVAAANLLFIPFGEKLKANIDNEILFREMIVNGVLCISNGDNSQLIAKKLSAYHFYQS